MPIAPSPSTQSMTQSSGPTFPGAAQGAMDQLNAIYASLDSEKQRQLANTALMYSQLTALKNQMQQQAAAATTKGGGGMSPRQALQAALYASQAAGIQINPQLASALLASNNVGTTMASFGTQLQDAIGKIATTSSSQSQSQSVGATPGSDGGGSRSTGGAALYNGAGKFIPPGNSEAFSNLFAELVAHQDARMRNNSFEGAALRDALNSSPTFTGRTIARPTAPAVQPDWMTAQIGAKTPTTDNTRISTFNPNDPLNLTGTPSSASAFNPSDPLNFNGAINYDPSTHAFDPNNVFNLLQQIHGPLYSEPAQAGEGAFTPTEGKQTFAPVYSDVTPESVMQQARAGAFGQLNPPAGSVTFAAPTVAAEVPVDFGNTSFDLPSFQSLQ